MKVKATITNSEQGIKIKIKKQAISIQQVRILGQEVRIGTKKHAILVQQVKIFNQNKEEYNS